MKEIALQFPPGINAKSGTDSDENEENGRDYAGNSDVNEFIDILFYIYNEKMMWYKK